MIRGLLRLAAITFALTLSQPGAARDKLVVLLDWFVNPDHAPLVIAQEKGLFAEHGLDVTLIEPADPSAPPRLLSAGQGDIAIGYQPNLYLQVKEGLEVKRLGTLVATPLNSLVVLADGPVRSIADLKGRKIGYSIAGFEDALLGAMLEHAGLTLSDVQLVNINFALTPALLGGQVDAVIGAFRNFELTELALAGKPGRAFFPEEHGVPAYDELIYLTRQGDDARFRRFLDAVEEATLLILNDPEGMWAVFAKARPRLDDALNAQAWRDTVGRLQASPAAVDPVRYERFGAFMKARGLIDRVEPVGRYIGGK